MRLQTVLIVLVLLLARKSPAQQVFDSHVHLWEGEKSLRQYEAEAKTAGIDLVGFGGMWFGGPNQALSGHPDEIRASNEAHFALAKKHPEMLPFRSLRTGIADSVKLDCIKPPLISCTAKHVFLTPKEKSNGEWRIGPRTIALTSLLVLDESWAAPVKHLGQRAGYTILGFNDAPRPKAKFLHLYVLIPSFQKQLPRDTTGLVISAIARGSLNLVNRIVRWSALFLS